MFFGGLKNYIFFSRRFSKSGTLYITRSGGLKIMRKKCVFAFKKKNGQKLKQKHFLTSTFKKKMCFALKKKIGKKVEKCFVCLTSRFLKSWREMTKSAILRWVCFQKVQKTATNGQKWQKFTFYGRKMVVSVWAKSIHKLLFYNQWNFWGWASDFLD